MILFVWWTELTCNSVSCRLYAHTQSSLALLEKVSVCVAKNEPVLLVGETGVGKTATINYLAELTGLVILMCFVMR